MVPRLGGRFRASGYSTVGTFTTGACPITAPTNLDADTIDADSIHYEWTKGVDNLQSCVDTAETENDLNNLTGTWANHGCGTTADEVVVDGLKCNTTSPTGACSPAAPAAPAPSAR